MDPLAQQVTLALRVAARFKNRTAIIAKDYDSLLKMIAEDGKMVVQASKALPAKWRREADAALKEVLASDKGNSRGALDKDAKAVHGKIIQIIDNLSKNFNHDIAEKSYEASWGKQHEEAYWDPEWIADGQDIKHPLAPLDTVAWDIGREFKDLWRKAVLSYTPGELHRSLYALTPKDLHDDVDKIAEDFFSEAAKGDLVKAFRDFWAGVKKLSVKASTSSSPKGMSLEDASWELKKEAEKAHDRWTAEFADTLARQFMRKKKPTPKQLSIFHDKLQKYNVGPLHGV